MSMTEIPTFSARFNRLLPRAGRSRVAGCRIPRKEIRKLLLARKEAIMSDGSAGTVVLVHGGFVDGSGWQGVYDQLTEDGYSVSVVQNPTISLAGDADATRRVIDAQS
jgi:hypothetical protein